MILKVNCQYCSKYYFCNHPQKPRFLGVFKRECGFVNSWSFECELQKEYPEPKAFSNTRGE